MNPQTASQINTPQIGSAECGDACDTMKCVGDERDSLVREVLSLRQQLAGAQAKSEEYRLREYACYQALGYSPPVSDALPHLIECMMGIKARLQDSLDSIERATGFQPGTEPLSTWVERVVKERDAAQKACAEMRQVMESAWVAVWDGHYGKGVTVEYARAVDAEVKHALSTDCGKDFVPRVELEKVMNAERREQARLINERDEARAELDQLRAQVKPLVKALREIRDLCQITGLTPERGWIMSVELAQQALITAEAL